MAYKVVITERAKQSLSRYIRYTAVILKNREAAISIRDDAKDTKERLSRIADVLPICYDLELAKLGYRKISFRNYDFFMLYRIEGNTVFVDNMYHELQDYESTITGYLQL